jgi:hypothetical protein
MHAKRYDILNSLVKLSIAAAAIGLVYMGVDYARKAASRFNFEVVGYGKPTFSGWNLTVPLVIRFTNPTPIPIAADRVLADIYINKAGQWVAAARIDQPVTIASGKTDYTIFPVLNLANIFGGNIFNTVSAIAQGIQSKVLEIRADVTIQYGAISLPTQSFHETLPLS